MLCILHKLGLVTLGWADPISFICRTVATTTPPELILIVVGKNSLFLCGIRLIKAQNEFNKSEGATRYDFSANIAFLTAEDSLILTEHFPFVKNLFKLNQIHLF